MSLSGMRILAQGAAQYKTINLPFWPNVSGTVCRQFERQSCAAVHDVPGVVW
jgi:hypothetical protein